MLNLNLDLSNIKPVVEDIINFTVTFDASYSIAENVAVKVQDINIHEIVFAIGGSF